MEFLKIGDSSLKITLSETEAELYDLGEKSSLDNEEMKKTFQKLLQRAKKEVGYKYSGERIVAEIFSSKNGGCEIFLSYVEGDMYKEQAEKPTKRPKPQIAIYSLKGIDVLLSLMYRLNLSSFRGRCTIFYDKQNEKYYIMFEDVSIKELKYAFICEYAEQVKPTILPYLKENCKCICKKDAVKLLSSI